MRLPLFPVQAVDLQTRDGSFAPAPMVDRGDVLPPKAAQLDVPAHPKNVLLASLPDERLIERTRDYRQLARSHRLTPCAGRIGRLAYENCRSWDAGGWEAPVPERILLSVPHMEGHERSFVEQAFESNWLSTVGPHLEAFEQEFARLAGAPAVALSSGTAAIHLGLRLLGVGPGDEIFAPTLTFVASVNPVVYLGARPVFIDSDPATWNMDPQLLRETLAARAARNRLPRAVVVVHLYGQPADLGPILDACAPYAVPVLTYA